MAYLNGKKIMFTAKAVLVNSAQEYDQGYSEGFAAGVEAGFNDGDSYRRRMMFGLIGRDFDAIEPEYLDGLTYVGGYAFYNYSKLKSVNLPESVTELRGAAFQNCTALTSFIFSEKVTNISGSAFNGCSSLTELVIPASVTNIGTSALKIGSASKKATIEFLGTTPPQIASNTFDFNTLEKIIVPQGSLEAYTTGTNWALVADNVPIEEEAL